MIAKFMLHGNIGAIVNGAGIHENFVEILDGYIGENFAEVSGSSIKDVMIVRGLAILDNNGKLWNKVSENWHWMIKDIKTKELVPYPEEYGTNVKQIYKIDQYASIIEKNDGSLWYHAGPIGDDSLVDRWKMSGGRKMRIRFV